MPPRLRSSLTPQRVLNTVAAILLLASAPVLSSTGVGGPAAVADNPPVAVITLNESSVAAELASQLPLVLNFSDRMGTAEFAPLPEPLDIDSADQMSGYRAGDVAYLASEQSIVVFLSEGTAVPAGDLVLVGHVTSGLNVVAGCVRDCAVQIVAADGIAGADDQ
ncbi:cyclophilin-like fold protein [Microbacterium sp. P5_E9]